MTNGRARNYDLAFDALEDSEDKLFKRRQGCTSITGESRTGNLASYDAPITTRRVFKGKNDDARTNSLHPPSK
jgi:hypothetical protein